MRTYKPTGRRRGAPLGNTNALKHGEYSRHISALDVEELQSMPAQKRADELALARARLVDCLQKQSSASPDDWLTYERAIAHYLRIIFTLTHKNAVLGQDRRAAYVPITEMIGRGSEEQDDQQG